MAEKLSAERATGNLSRASFLEFVERHEGIDEELAEHQETGRSIRRRRKDLRKTITAAGIVIDEFDRHLIDEKRSGDEREAADHAYRLYMSWRGKPIGFQGKLDMPTNSPVDALAFEQHEVKRADRDGFKAGKAGDRADSNPWRPGSEPFAAWHSSWLRGQAEKVTTEIKPADADAPRRGRPRSAERIARDTAAAVALRDMATRAEQELNGGDPKLPLGPAAVAARSAEVAEPMPAAHALGKEDGLAGHVDHAARYPAGEIGHADYYAGHAEGERERLLSDYADPLPGGGPGMDEALSEDAL